MLFSTAWIQSAIKATKNLTNYRTVLALSDRFSD